MKKFDWYKTDIDKKITELKKMPQTKEVQIALEACEDLLFEVNNPVNLCISGDYNIADVFYSEYLNLKKVEFMWNSLLDFHFSSNKLSGSFSNKQLILSESDILTLVHDFYKNATTKDIFNGFLKLYKQRKENFSFVTDIPNGFYADSYFIPYLNDFYVQIAPERSFNDVASIAHEYAHGIQLINNYHPNMYNVNFVFMEIISVFFDFLTYDYYSKNPELGSYAKAEFKNFYNNKIDCSTNIIWLIAYIKELDIKNDNIKNAIRKITMFMSTGEKYAFECTCQERKISEDIPYVLGTAISIELLNIYHQDPEKAFYLIKKIISINPVLPAGEYFNQILNLGIILGQSTPIFEKNLKRELKLS